MSMRGWIRKTRGRFHRIRTMSFPLSLSANRAVAIIMIPWSISYRLLLIYLLRFKSMDGRSDQNGFGLTKDGLMATFKRNCFINPLINPLSHLEAFQRQVMVSEDSLKFIQVSVVQDVRANLATCPEQHQANL